MAGALIIALIVAGGINKVLAQDSSASTKSTTQEPAKPLEAYRLDFSINELEDGKKINTRQYSMNLTPNQPQDIKIGTRVPVESKQGEFDYLDVGTNISGRLMSRNGQLELIVNTDMSNFAIPEQASGHEAHPVIRQLRIGGSTLVMLGKPMVIGSADDPNSKRQFQVEVTMTKLR
ncbi:MAG: hypothetical protein WBD25_08935 [Terriglobales bacterium]